MSNVTGEVAKALKDALPSLDFNKLVNEARKQLGIVVIGEEGQAETLLGLLRAGGSVPGDVKVVVWRFVEGNNPPLGPGKTELAIIVPATAEHMEAARKHFSGVGVLPIVLPGVEAAPDLEKPVTLSALDAEQVRKTLVPALVERLWERRLALGRSLPATRDRIAWLLIRHAVRDPKFLLGAVASAGSGRSGAPTPATATLLIQQAALIANMAAIYGYSLDDRRAVYAHVAPNLTPTLALDSAEALASRLAAAAGKGHPFEKIYGPAAAYTVRPILSVGSTVLAGLIARRVFRGDPERPSLPARARALGSRAAAGLGQGAAAVGVVAARLREKEPAASLDPAPPPEAVEEAPRAAASDPAPSPPPDGVQPEKRA